MSEDRSREIQAEFSRVARGFAERTRGRFDSLDAVAFSGLEPGGAVVEVGAGTGSFLSLFSGVAGSLVAVDLTVEMLAEARRNNDVLLTVAGDGARLPLRSGGFELACTAQVLHHVSHPVPLLRELRRVLAPGGAVLVVDQVASESFEQIAFMNQLEALRDPTHATSRPPSAFRVALGAAGLEVEEERIVEGRNRFSDWMRPGEFSEERIAAVLDFIERFGPETGMDFAREGDEWTFNRRRIMLRARRG